MNSLLGLNPQDIDYLRSQFEDDFTIDWLRRLGQWLSTKTSPDSSVESLCKEINALICIYGKSLPRLSMQYYLSESQPILVDIPDDFDNLLEERLLSIFSVLFDTIGKQNYWFKHRF